MSQSFTRIKLQLLNCSVRDAEISIAVEQPDLTLSHAATLAGNVDRFVDWWSKILPIANDAKYLAGCLKPEIRVFGVLLMQAVSGGIRDACKQYKDQVRVFYNSMLFYMV